MTTYHQYEKGRYGEGTIVVRITRDGDEVRAFLRTIDTPEDAEADSVYPSESAPPEKALRLAENKRQGTTGAEIVVELDAGVEWDPDWGTLEGMRP